MMDFVEGLAIVEMVRQFLRIDSFKKGIAFSCSEGSK